MKAPPTWGIVGLGWLGAAVADAVIARGGRIWGTHRGDFTFGRDDFPSRAADVLLLNTPPVLDLDPAAYVRTVAVDDDARILFVSSTSVYGAGPGLVTESSPPRPATASARWLVATEDQLRARFGARLVIVRPGGLIGGARHPVHALAGGREIDDGPVNLIHRLDLVEILLRLAETPVPLVNAVAPHHPPKSTYYAAWAERLGLAPVHVRAAEGPGRLIASEVLPSLYPAWRRPRLDRLD